MFRMKETAKEKVVFVSEYCTVPLTHCALYTALCNTICMASGSEVAPEGQPPTVSPIASPDSLVWSKAAAE